MTQEDLLSALGDRDTFAAALQRALSEQRLLLYAQDVHDLRQPGVLLYRELLLRLRDVRGRVLSPEPIVAAAEEHELVAQIDVWVVQRLLEHVARTPDEKMAYACNLSGRSLSNPGFLAATERAVAASGADPRRLCFEITETAAITRLNAAADFMQRLAATGCRFALDDFGAGHATFAYIRQLPVQFLKIDGSLISVMSANERNRAVVESLNRLGHDLGLITIAEHAQDRATVEELTRIGFDGAQGHIFGEPSQFYDRQP